MPWSRAFDDPVPGIVTLKDAATTILKLPKAEQATPHWQAAIEAVILAAEDKGPLMHARVGMLRALNHVKPNPDIEPRVKRAKKYRIVR